MEERTKRGTDYSDRCIPAAPLNMGVSRLVE
jgi:hypothetical protein